MSNENKQKSTLTKLYEELRDDSHLDVTQLENENVRNASIFAKWNYRATVYKRQLAQLEKRSKEIRAEKFKTLNGLTNGITHFSINKKESAMLIEGDCDVADLDEKIAVYKGLIDFCNTAMTIMNQKSFSIRNQIDLAKFKAGVDF